MDPNGVTAHVYKHVLDIFVHALLDHLAWDYGYRWPMGFTLECKSFSRLEGNFVNF